MRGPNPIDRRRCTRRVPGRAEPLARIRLRTGWEMTVVDLSDSGALVEGGARLLPGTHVDVHVVTREGRVLVRSRVVRAHVCHVQSDAVRYRGALAFDRRVETASHGYVVPGPPSGQAGVPGSAYPERPAAEGRSSEEPLAVQRVA